MKTSHRFVLVLVGLAAAVTAGIYLPLGVEPSGINPAKAFDLDAATFATTQNAANSGDADANFRLGQFWMYIGRPDCSKPWFQKAHRLGDNRAGSWLLQLKTVEESAEGVCDYPKSR